MHSWCIVNVQAEDKTVKVIRDDSGPPTYNETAVVLREDSTHIMTNASSALKIKAARVGSTVNDFAGSTVNRIINTAKSKAKEFYNSDVFNPASAAARKDSAEIAYLGPIVTDLAAEFERMETIVCEHSYPDQVRLLTGYKKLLEFSLRWTKNVLSINQLL